MRAGDLVEVATPCNGTRRGYRLGEVGLVIGPAQDLRLSQEGYLSVLFDDGCEDFNPRLLEVIDEEGRSCSD